MLERLWCEVELSLMMEIDLVFVVVVFNGDVYFSG